MAVHLPLSIEAQVEATTLMMSTNNIFSPSNGAPIISPSQDIVMGCYYCTMKRSGRPGEGMTFASTNEALMAYSMGKIVRHAIIKLRLPKGKRVKGEGADTYTSGSLISTTVGRIIFNDMLYPGMAFYNHTMKSKDLQHVISDCYLEFGRKRTIELLDSMKRTGFTESTRSGLSFGISDLVVPPTKEKYILEAEGKVLKQQKLYDRGVITQQERYNSVIDIWTHSREQITTAMKAELESDLREKGAYVNPIYLMADSGARGGMEQIRQLAVCVV